MSQIKAVLTELKVQQIVVKQMQEGFNFDGEHCEKTIQGLTDLKDSIYNEIKPKLKSEVIPLEGKVTSDTLWAPRNYTVLKGEHTFVKKKFLRNGDLTKVLQLYCDKTGLDPDLISGPFSRVAFEELELSKRGKLAKQLIGLGWKPSEYTEKGFPKLTVNGDPCPGLENIEGDIGSQLATWFKASHRQSQMQGWVERSREDGRIEAGINTGATNTHRSRHFTVANVPSVGAFYGKEMRSAFIATPGYELCGWDASGLEARVAGHYTLPIDDGEFADILMSGDIHQRNADHFGVTRSHAKTIYYGLLYGAQQGKVREIVGCSAKRAKEIFDAFWQVNKALGKVRDKCVKMHDRKGYVPGLDGRKVYTRSSHSAMNTLFQSAGAIIMSNAIVNFDAVLKGMVREGVEGAEKLTQVVFYHDEIAVDYVQEQHKERMTSGAIDSIQKAGKDLGFRLELSADTQFGNSWADIH